MRNLTTKFGRQDFQICLQREDSLESCGCVRMEAQGVVFNSARHLDLMADLLIRIECLALECRRRARTVEGTVIGCEESAGGCFEITVLFLQEEDFDFTESFALVDLAAVNPQLN